MKHLAAPASENERINFVIDGNPPTREYAISPFKMYTQPMAHRNSDQTDNTPPQDQEQFLDDLARLIDRYRTSSDPQVLLLTNGIQTLIDLTVSQQP